MTCSTRWTAMNSGQMTVYDNSPKPAKFKRKSALAQAEKKNSITKGKSLNTRTRVTTPAATSANPLERIDEVFFFLSVRVGSVCCFRWRRWRGSSQTQCPIEPSPKGGRVRVVAHRRRRRRYSHARYTPTGMDEDGYKKKRKYAENSSLLMCIWLDLASIIDNDQVTEKEIFFFTNSNVNQKIRTNEERERKP